MKHILITGGAGFIGAYLTEALHAKGCQVTVLDVLSPQIHAQWEGSFLEQKIREKCRFIKGDVTRTEDWREALQGVDSVVHLAAETGTGQSMYEVDRYYQVNVQGTARFLDLLVNEKLPIKRMVIASSRAIYGEGKYADNAGNVHFPAARREEDMTEGRFDPLDGYGNPLRMLPTDEDSKLHPASIYGLTKLAQEQMIMLMGKQMGIAATGLRFQNVYGPGQSLSNPYTGLLAVFSNRIRNGNPLDIYEDGQETRDFVYISDIVDSIILALENEAAAGQVYNVGSGIATPVLKVAQLMAEYFGIEVPIQVSGRFRVGDIRHNQADLTRIAGGLGFEAKVSFEAGLKAFVDWVTGQDVQEDRYEASLAEIRAKGLMK